MQSCALFIDDTFHIFSKQFKRYFFLVAVMMSGGACASAPLKLHDKCIIFMFTQSFVGVYVTNNESIIREDD